jgi:hypothetical protein
MTEIIPPKLIGQDGNGTEFFDKRLESRFARSGLTVGIEEPGK